MSQKKHDVYRGEDCMKKFYESLRACNEDSQLWKEENDSISKQTVGII